MTLTLTLRRLILLLCCLVAATAPASAEDVTVAFWNVENLFDNKLDRRSPREDLFTSSELAEKLRKDGEILRELDADIVGLMEVENRGVLRRLVDDHLADQGYKYVVLMDEGDERGIDVALISRYPVLGYSFDVPGFYRGILLARVAIAGKPLYVIVNHWKSRIGGGEETRMACSRRVVELVRDIIPAMEGDTDVAVMVGGDLNDNHHDASVLHLEQNGLVNTLKSLPAERRWTLPYDNQSEQRVELDSFDHILINGVWGPDRPFELVTSEVLRPQRMVVTRRLYGREFLWPDDDDSDHIGYSDHFPVRAHIRVK